jgi:hypothetical protein
MGLRPTEANEDTTSIDQPLRGSVEWLCLTEAGLA